MSWVSEVSADTPNAWFRLGETSGTSAADNVGGTAGTYTGVFTLNQRSLIAGDANPAVDLFDGYIRVADRAALDLADTFTLEAWIYPTAYRDSVMGPGCFIDKGANSYIFRFAGTNDGIFILRRNGVQDIAVSNVRVPLNQISHVVATKSGATVKLYLNGRDVTGTVTNQTMTDNANPFIIGASDGGIDNYFVGIIDDVVIYNTALSASRVLAHYNAGTQNPSVFSSMDVDGVTNATLRVTASTRLPLATVRCVSNLTLSVQGGSTGSADIIPRTIPGIGLPTLEIKTPAVITASSMAISIDCPPDWTAMTTAALAATNAPYARLDYSRMTSLAAANAAFSAVRGQGAFAIVMFPYATSASTITAFCSAHGMGASDVVELGNETSYSYQTTNANLPSVAQAYANYAAGVRNAFTSAGTRCQLVAQGDPAMRGTTWIDNMFIAQPRLHTLVTGFSVHPYGPSGGGAGYDGYNARLSGMISQLINKGAPSTTPIYITEYGIASDDGTSMVPDNYGWPVNLTYAQQSSNLIAAIRDIKARFRTVRILSIFQAIDQAVHLADTDREHYFGVLKRDGSAKPVATAIRGEVEATGATAPYAAVLDNFNRANGGLGSNWTTMIGTDPLIGSNWVSPNSGGAGPSGAYWNLTRWADAQAYIRMGVAGEVRVYARMTSASGNGYRVRYDPTVSEISIAIVNSGVGTDLVRFTGHTLAADDSLGIVVEDTTISAWKRTGTGSWVFVGSITNSTYSAAGFIGFVIQNTGVRVDDFGGGDLSTSDIGDITPASITGLGAVTVSLDTGESGIEAPIVNAIVIAVSTLTLRVTAATRLAFGTIPAIGTATFLFSSSGRPAVDPDTVQGQSDLSIVFTVGGAIQLVLGRITGIGTATIALRQFPQLPLSPNYGGEDPFLWTIARSHRIATRATLFQPNDNLELTTTMDGSVICDARAAIRRRCDVLISLPADSPLIPSIPTDPITPYGNEIKLERGVYYPNGEAEYASLGVFLIRTVDVDDSGDDFQVRITGMDRAQRIIDARFEAPYQVAVGTNLGTAILTAIQDAYPDVEYSFPVVTYTSTATLIAEEGSDRWEFCQKMATSLGMDLYFDANGVLVLEPMNLTVPAWQIVEGNNGVLLRIARGWTREGTYNRVIATGENLGDGVAPVRGVATDDDPNSPTYYSGPYGRVPMFYTSEFLTTNTQCANAASSILQRQLGTTQTVSFGSLVNPKLKPGDLVTVTRQRARIDEQNIVDSLTIPLGADQSMAGQTRAVVI